MPEPARDLIGRACALAAIALELDVVRYVDPIDAVATWLDESGGYALAHRINDNGTSDYGTCMENDVHGRTAAERVKRIGAITYWLEVLAPARVRIGDHPLADYNSWKSGRFAKKRKYAAEGWRIVTAPHPTAWP